MNITNDEIAGIFGTIGEQHLRIRILTGENARLKGELAAATAKLKTLEEADGAEAESSTAATVTSGTVRARSDS